MSEVLVKLITYATYSEFDSCKFGLCERRTKQENKLRSSPGFASLFPRSPDCLVGHSLIGKESHLPSLQFCWLQDGMLRGI